MHRRKDINRNEKRWATICTVSVTTLLVILRKWSARGPLIIEHHHFFEVSLIRLLSDPRTHIHGLPHIPCTEGIEALDRTSVNARWVSPGKYRDWIISGLTIHSLPAVMIITPISIRYIRQRIDSNINHDVTRWKSPVIILWFTDQWSFFSWYF